MGEVTPFRAACMAQGWGQPRRFLAAFEQAARILGEPTELTDRQFRRWCRPDPPTPRPRAWRVLHAMFGLDPCDLGFPGPPPGAIVGAATPLAQEGSTVDRRAFLQDSIAAAAGTGLPPLSTPPSSTGAVGTAHLVELRGGLRSLFQLDDAFGGGEVRRLAVRHLRRIRRIINTGSYPETIGRQLQLLEGEAAEHCGWLHFDAQDPAMARRFLGEALTTATVLKDDGLEILVLASLSLLNSYDGRPREAYNLARAASERAARYGSPVLQSILAAREARALSLTGDSSAARKKLTASMRYAEHTGRGRTPEWTSFHGQAELDFAQGTLYSEAGHHKAAIPYLRAALAHQHQAYGRNRALYRLTLATNLIQAGEVDEGATQAVTNLDQIDEVESGRVTHRLRDVTALLRTSTATAARDAADELTEYLDTRGAAA